MLNVKRKMLKPWGIILAIAFLSGGFSKEAASANKDIYPQYYSFDLPHAKNWSEGDRRLWDAYIDKYEKLDRDINFFIGDFEKIKKAERETQEKKEVDMDNLDYLIAEGIRTYGQIDYLKKERSKIDNELKALWKENNANAKSVKLSPEEIKEELRNISSYENLELKIFQEYRRKLHRLGYEMDEVAQKTGDADLAQKLHRAEIKRKMQRTANILDILGKRKEQLAKRLKGRRQKTVKLMPLNLPAGRTISVTAIRKKKSKEAVAVSKIDLSGCWVDDEGRKITINQQGSKVSAKYPYYGRVFSGSLNRDDVTLLYIFKDVNDYVSIHWKKYYTDNRPIPRKVLAQALSKQQKYDYGFKFKIVSEDELTGNLLHPHLQWDWDSEELRDFFIETIPATWRRQKAKLKSISFSDSTFKKKLTEINAGGSFWITAAAAAGCKEAVDRAVVSVYRQGDEQKKEVKLIETGPNTLEFRSPRAIKLSQLNAKQGDKIIIRSGLKGASLKVKKAEVVYHLTKDECEKAYSEYMSALQKSVRELIDTIEHDAEKGHKKQISPRVKKLLKKKKEVAAKLKKIEDKFTYRNLYPDASGEGYLEALQDKKAQLEEWVLEEMRAKNELLAQYPNGDTSDYDKEIARLKSELEALNGYIKEKSQGIKKDIGSLKKEKAKLEKKLNSIIKEIKKTKNQESGELPPPPDKFNECIKKFGKEMHR